MNLHRQPHLTDFCHDASDEGPRPPEWNSNRCRAAGRLLSDGFRRRPAEPTSVAWGRCRWLQLAVIRTQRHW